MSKNKLNVGKNFSDEKIQLTPEGKKALEERLEYLLNEVRPEVIEELQKAREQGDLSENADYDASKNRQAEVEAEIRKVEDQLSRAEIINTKKKSQTHIGSTITYIDEDSKETRKIKLVGQTEFNLDVEIPNVAIDSPLGLALNKKKLGDVVTVTTPKKTYKVKIEQIG